MVDEETNEKVRNALAVLLIILGVYVLYGVRIGELPPNAAVDGWEAILEGLQTLAEVIIVFPVT